MKAILLKEPNQFAESHLGSPPELIPNRQPIAPSRIDCTQANAGLLFDHDPFTVAEVSWLVRQLVTTRGERSLRIARQSVRLVNQFIRQPLMMNPRRIDGLLDI